jgi:hypothetical protein
MLLVFLLSALSMAAAPGDKRTILTSGDKVFTIHYQLGQSTTLYFGTKPETVICGNKNYFAIEKIKEGLTIQPLGNFSTNLTVMNHGERFLFYLTPAKGALADNFVDVRWIPEQDAKLVAHVGGNTKELVRDLGQKIRLGTLDLKLLREVQIDSVKRTIFEFEVTNNASGKILSSDIELLAVKGIQPLGHQVAIFERDELKAGATTKGRLILTNADTKGVSLVINYQGKSGKVQVKAGPH